jgi:hypothetical protein
MASGAILGYRARQSGRRSIPPNRVTVGLAQGQAISMSDSRGLVRASRLPDSALVVVSNDHRLADPEPLQAMLGACEGSFNNRRRGDRKE